MLALRHVWRAAVLIAAPLAITLASCISIDGSAVVRGHLSLSDCRMATPESLRDFSFEAGYISTERYSGVLLISIQKHQVEVEETDGLVIRLELRPLLESGVLVVDNNSATIRRADTGIPLRVRTSTSRGDANVALSLFQTCPEFPTQYAVDGWLELDKLTLAANPVDTGDGERIGGTLTATMARVSSRTPVGTIEAIFDFAPPRRPLTDFK